MIKKEKLKRKEEESLNQKNNKNEFNLIYRS